MRTLYILRHATAASADASEDFDRPLVDQGLGEAVSQGSRFAEWRWPLRRVVASTALRAQQTASAFIEGYAREVSLQAEELFYNAPGEQLMELIQRFPDEDDAVLAVAHVPGVAHLLSMLTTEHVDLIMGYPPATLSAVQLDIDAWADVDYGVGLLFLYLPPLPV